ncbi:MAG: molybdopterin molybdotransferase MoeA [Bdellovibrionales bacterium]|nr:molybdopterin molybdotransferase MoeA [Bdellovibrionales bacterium]
MISVQKAEELLALYPPAVFTQTVSLEDSLHKVLAQSISSKRDQPPFHRVAMDGIALRFDDYKKGIRSFKVANLQKAGEPQKTLDAEGACIEVMTGAVLPKNTDCVVRYEDIEIIDGYAQLNIEVDFMQNIHQKGSDHQQGTEVLPAGVKMTSPRIGIAASNGYSQVQIYAMPKIAIVSTGDELVDLQETPQDHQIYRSNSFSLQAELNSFGFKDIQSFHIEDNKESLLEKLSFILNEYGVVILSGGVSMGKFDFLPQILSDLKTKEIFHKISQRPGKPFWYGVGEKGQGVYALPGNPVSCLVCLRRYVVPALYKAMGSRLDVERGSQSEGVLAKDFTFEKNLTYFLPVKASKNHENIIELLPCPTNGSGDYGALGESDGFIELPLEKTFFKKGESYKYFPWGHI